MPPGGAVESDGQTYIGTGLFARPLRPGRDGYPASPGLAHAERPGTL